MKKKHLKTIGIVFSIIVVAVGVFFGGKYIVQAVVENDYVEGDPIDLTEDEIYLTKSGKGVSITTRPDSADNTISLPEMPEYGEADMFLEIVPDKCQQVLSWLSADNAVISDEELTRRISLVKKGPVKDQNVTNDSLIQPLTGLSYKNFHVWNPEINLYEKKDDGTYKYQEIFDKVKEIADNSELTQKEKKDQVEAYIQEKCYISMGLYSVKDKYVIESKEAFGVGSAFSKVSSTALSDKYNWDTELISSQEVSTSFHATSGYFVKVDAVSDDTLALDMGNKKAASNIFEQRFRVFKYTTQLPSGQKIQDYSNYNPSDTNWFTNNIGNIKVGDYYEIPSNEEWNISTISYDNTYKYTYHCMVNNDVLKWGLLNPYEDQEHITLKNEDEWEIEYNRRFKVVTVTPEQLNELEKYDTRESLDYIERADLLYLNSIPGRDGQEFQVMQTYYKYVQEYREVLQPDGSIQVVTKDLDTNNLKTYQNSSDIEWSICMKLIKKIGTYVNFPVLVNSNLWTQNKCEGRTVPVYKSGPTSWRTENHDASLSNASKVCIIASQFNLLARKHQLPEGLSKDEQEGYINFFKNIADTYTDEGLYKGDRTFMEDIYPYIQKIKVKNSAGTHEYTGYYDRTTNLAEEDKPSSDDKDFYLWGDYTFYPIGYDKNAANWTVELKKVYGYLETFAFNGTNASDTTEKNPSNREMFYGTDADRSSSGKHYQNVVGQPVNQSIFTTDGNRFLQIFSSLREILLKPQPNAIAKKMIVKVKKPAFKHNDEYGWFLNLYEDEESNKSITSDNYVTVTFTVENPAENKNDGYFYVQEVNVNEGEDAKTPQHYEEKLKESKVYIQEDDCIDVEITDKEGNPVELKTLPDAERKMTGYKVPEGEIFTFKFKYRLTDYLGTTSGLDGKKYPKVLFSTRVVGYDYEPIGSAQVSDLNKSYLVKKDKAYSTCYTINYDVDKDEPSKEGLKKALLNEGSDASVWEYTKEKPTSGTCINDKIDEKPSILDPDKVSAIKTGDYIALDSAWQFLEVTEKTEPATDYVQLDFMKRHLFNLQ